MHIFKFLKPGLTNFKVNVEQSISTRSLKDSQVRNLPGNLPRQGEIDLWRHTGDEITFCWSFNKLSCERHCNTILSGKQKGMRLVVCAGLLSLVSQCISIALLLRSRFISKHRREGGALELSKGRRGDGKVGTSTSSSQGTAWEDGRVSPHPIHAVGNGFSPFSCSDCSQQG